MSSSSNPAVEPLVILDGVRTPFCRAGTDLRGAAAADLAAHVFRELLDRTGIDPAKIGEVILGCGGADAREANVARVAGLRAGVPQSVPAVTVQRNCASGMEALFQAWLRVRAGDGDLFLVGGAESMSSYPLVMNATMTALFERLAKAKTIPQRMRAVLSARPSMLRPRIALKEGLTDPVSGMMMGACAERLARRFDIARQRQDEFALRSHQRACAAREHQRFDAEIAPMPGPPRFGSMVCDDNGIRDGQTLAALSRLRPVFDRRHGDVTVGNACQITDGAVGMLVASRRLADELGLQPLAVFTGHGRVGLAPPDMGLGPVHATPLALQEAGVSLSDVDLVEINEAFAAQVLACTEAMASADYCRSELGLEDAIGEIGDGQLNVNGGAIALGHPIAASGARIVLTLAHELRRRGGKRGLATLCIGGGQGQAMVLEAA